MRKIPWGDLALWLPTLFLVYVFATQGSSKFSDSSGWAKAFRTWHYPVWFRILIGVLEISANGGDFEDLGAKTLSIRNTGGTDHLPFEAVGLPGFQFIQDPLDYMSRTHHSNIDDYDHLQAGDLMQASAIVASFVYNAATRPEMLPRKPMPKPLPPKRPEAS